MERFLYRLSRSAYADRLILKGALMMRVWRSAEFRPTMDIDLLGRASNEEAEVTAQIREVIGDEAELMLYVNSAWDLPTAIEDARNLRSRR